MTKILMRERFRIDLDADKDRFVFVGDSPNDAPMFEYFPHSVGVANIRDFDGLLRIVYFMGYSVLRAPDPLD